MTLVELGVHVPAFSHHVPYVQITWNIQLIARVFSPGANYA